MNRGVREGTSSQYFSTDGRGASSLDNLRDNEAAMMAVQK